MITGDLDAQLAASLATVATAGKLPAVAIAGTWRPAPDGNPYGYATSVPFEIARLNGRSPADVAAALANRLRPVSWISDAAPSGGGYLTVTVTPRALAESAARMVAAGPACAQSTVLRGTTATVPPWPDLEAAVSWQQAWQDQADAITGRLAQAAGAATSSEWKRAGAGAPATRSLESPVQAAVAYRGASSVRYGLARSLPGGVTRLSEVYRAGAPLADPLYPVQQAHAAAASTLRWAADLQVPYSCPGPDLADLLSHPGERALLGLLSWLPVRVAAAAHRTRPDELPRYLEQVSAAWLAASLSCPALPFGGLAAPAGPDVASARLLLADAARVVLAAGLALVGIAAVDRL